MSSAAQRLIVALDVNSREAALKLVAALRPRVSRFKVGMELFTACGPALVREILAADGQVFLDLKYHDIPNTVARAAVEAARLGVGMLTVHLSGGSMMARRAVDEVDATCQIHRLARPQILGVTVLTSLSDADLSQVGVTRGVDEQVLALASLAAAAGLDGVVASPREVRAVRAAWPVSKPMFIRVSTVDGAGGWEVEDTVVFAKALKELGVDVIDCSSGGLTGLSTALPVKRSLGFQVPFAAAVKRQAGIHTMAVGLILDGPQAEAILQAGDADLIAIGRQALFDPFWALHAAQELGCDADFAMWTPEYGWWLDKRKNNLAGLKK